jgi:hypothetical protein
MRQRAPRLHDNSHLVFMRGLSCCACGNNTSTEAAHVRMACERAAKRAIGIGEKADDAWTVPLCSACHRLQHEIGEAAFWRHVGTDPIFLCLALYRVSGDTEAGEQIIAANQQ